MSTYAGYPEWWFEDELEDWGFGEWEDLGTVVEEWQPKAVIPERVKRPHPSRALQVLGILIILIGFPGIAPVSAIVAFYVMGQKRWDAQGFWPAGVLGIVGLILATAIAAAGLMIFDYGRKRQK